MNDIVSNALFGGHEIRPVVRAQVQRTFLTSEIAAFCGMDPRTFLRLRRIGRIKVEGTKVGAKMEYTTEEARDAREQVRKMHGPRYVG